MQQDEPDRSPRLMLQKVLIKDFGVGANDIPIEEFNTEMITSSVKILKAKIIPVDLVAENDEKLKQLIASPCFEGHRIFNKNLVAIYSKQTYGWFL